MNVHTASSTSCTTWRRSAPRLDSPSFLPSASPFLYRIDFSLGRSWKPYSTAASGRGLTKFYRPGCCVSYFILGPEGVASNWWSGEIKSRNSLCEYRIFGTSLSAFKLYSNSASKTTQIKIHCHYRFLIINFILIDWLIRRALVSLPVKDKKNTQKNIGNFYALSYSKTKSRFSSYVKYDALNITINTIRNYMLRGAPG